MDCYYLDFLNSIPPTHVKSIMKRPPAEKEMSFYPIIPTLLPPLPRESQSLQPWVPSICDSSDENSVVFSEKSSSACAFRLATILSFAMSWLFFSDQILCEIRERKNEASVVSLLNFDVLFLSVGDYNYYAINSSTQYSIQAYHLVNASKCILLLTIY